MAFKWLGGWLATIIALTILSNITWGRPIVYYTLWLMVVLLLIVSAPQIQGFFIDTGLQQEPTPPSS